MKVHFLGIVMCNSKDSCDIQNKIFIKSTYIHVQKGEFTNFTIKY